MIRLVSEMVGVGNLPVPEILYSTVCPSSTKEDVQEVAMFPLDIQVPNCLAKQVVGLWNITAHSSTRLATAGAVSVDITVGISVPGERDIVEVVKTLGLQLCNVDHCLETPDAEDQMSKHYTSYPKWAHPHLHGVVYLTELGGSSV